MGRKILYSIISVALLVCCSIFLVSCAAPRPLVYKSVQHFKLEQAGLQNTVLSMDLTLYNPNNYRMKLKRTGIDIFLNDHLLGNVQLQEEYLLPKKDTFLLPVILKVDVANVLPNAYELLVSKEVKLRLSGVVRAGRHGLYINVPVSYEGRQIIRK